MIINGLSPGLAFTDPAAANLDREELDQDIRVEKEDLEKKAAEDKSISDNRQNSGNEINEYYLKELLFLMSSKGNTATIEKLAELLKKEKETLSRIK
jgi:23S rRNA pseudoU1915 N3-methylase RlmH